MNATLLQRHRIAAANERNAVSATPLQRQMSETISQRQLTTATNKRNALTTSLYCSGQKAQRLGSVTVGVATTAASVGIHHSVCSAVYLPLNLFSSVLHYPLTQLWKETNRANGDLIHLRKVYNLKKKKGKGNNCKIATKKKVKSKIRRESVAFARHHFERLPWKVIFSQLDEVCCFHGFTCLHVSG